MSATTLPKGLKSEGLIQLGVGSSWVFDGIMIGPFDLQEALGEIESDEASNFALPIERFTYRILALFVLMYLRPN